jgi:hypothetical protein
MAALGRQKEANHRAIVPPIFDALPLTGANLSRSLIANPCLQFA